MTDVKFKGEIPRDRKNRINQGDYVYCEACNGAISFWGIYSYDCGVVSLDGGGTPLNVKRQEIYLGEIYVYWKIAKRVPCRKMSVVLEEAE